VRVDVDDADQVAIEKRPRSLAHLFLRRVEESADEDAFYYPVEGGWQESSWGHTHALVQDLAAGLLSLGVQPEDRVALVATTRYEWVLGFLATMWAGGAVTAVDPHADDETLAQILADSGSRVVIAEDYDVAAALWRIRGRIRDVVKVVQIDGDYPDQRVLTLEALLTQGQAHLVEQPRALSQRLYAVRRQGLALLPYVEDDAGGRRGVLLSHAALTYQASAVAALGHVSDADLLYLGLPLSTAYAQVLLAIQLAVGFPIALEGRPGHVIDSMAVVRPTVVAGTAAMLDDVRGHVEVSQPRGLLRRRRSRDKKLRSDVRATFGDRLRFVACAGGGVDADLRDFFAEAGVQVLEAYGRAETGGAVSVALPDDDGVHAGRPLPGTVVRVTDDGELEVSGPGLMDGYHRRPVDTSAVLSHGWLRTGDTGRLDRHGRLVVLGRHLR